MAMSSVMTVVWRHVAAPVSAPLRGSTRLWTAGMERLIRIAGDRQRTDQDPQLLGHVPVGAIWWNAVRLRRGDAPVAPSPHHRNDQAVCLARQRQAREAMLGV